MQTLRRFIGVTALLLSCSAFLYSQDATGRVIGIVTDPQGGVVAGAKVTVTNVDTQVSRSTVTGADGQYQVLQLPIGTYSASAEQPGFRRVVSSPEKLLINAALHIDMKLEVGALSEVVQVEAQTTGVETVAVTLGNSVTATQIVNAPLNGRNVLDLALLQPGVVPSESNAQSNGVGGFSVAGGRQDSVTYTLDGGINNNLLNNGVVYNPNPDMVEEFRILTSNYTAEFGRSGGGIVSVVTKSGTNTVHGSVYDYIRNDALNANSFFNNANGLGREILKRNQFGGSVGGPITIPKVLNGKDRFFFMVGYQGQRQSRLSTTAKTTVFTPAELNGDFSMSNAARTGPDPLVVSFLQANPYFQSNPSLAARGVIDPTRIDSVARNYIKSSLIPTSPSGSLIAQGADKDDRDELTEKVDLLFTPKDRLTVTLGSSRNPLLQAFAPVNAAPGSPSLAYANVPGYPGTGAYNTYFGSADYTKTLSPAMVNDFRFSAQRVRRVQGVPATKLPTPGQLGIGITPDESTGPTLLGFGSGMSLGFSYGGPTTLIDNTYTWSDTLSWIRGKHTMKFGFNYTPYQDNTLYDYYVNGEFFFYGTGGGSFSQNDRADFLMGLPDEFLQFPSAPSNIRSYNIGFFGQDEWKVRRNLTLTFGLRYEYNSPKYDTQGRSFSLAIGQQSTVFPGAPKGLLLPGDRNAPNGANFPDKNDFSPRMGFAWDPKGDGKSSLRGGIGMFYDILKAEDNLQFNGQAPFFGFADLFFDPLSDNPAGALNYMSQPFAATGQPNPFPSKPPSRNINFSDAGFLPAGGGGVYYVDQHLRTPYIFQYNLSYQREILRNTTVELAYMGSDSHKLTGLKDSNPFLKGTNVRLFNAQPGVDPNSFSYMDTFANVGSSNYNALIVSLAGRNITAPWLGSLQYQLSWTHGKSVDNVSGFRSRTASVPAYSWNQFRGVSDFYLPNYVSFQGSWEIPFDSLWQSGPRKLTKGWTFYPLVSFRSGQPLDIGAGLNRTRRDPGPSGVGDAQLVRVDLVSPLRFFDPRATTTVASGDSGNFYFDPAAFATPTSGYGTLGRNSFRGPNRTNVNMTIAKVTPLTLEGRVKLEIRADFFNMFNAVQFRNPDTNFTYGTFGQISQTYDPRIIQLAGRVTF